jgi:hypothetical protein
MESNFEQEMPPNAQSIRLRNPSPLKRTETLNCLLQPTLPQHQKTLLALLLIHN